MKNTIEFWFATGSQNLYGDECLKLVAAHSAEIVKGLNGSGALPFRVTQKPTLLDSASIAALFRNANADPSCAGVILWMHTFSPAKNWILGLSESKKPLLHFHTQFNREIPFDSIDMDFMNANQSAHGDREFAHILTRMNVARKTIVGHWADPAAQSKIAAWMRVAAGVAESRALRIVRFGDNMREVAVTEGDKVEAQIKFGWEIDGYEPSALAEFVNAQKKSDIAALTDFYFTEYTPEPRGRARAEFRKKVEAQAAIELGLRAFVSEKNYGAVVTTFQMLSGLRQLPGLAIQRLMADGYGFGAEGDWKTAALVRIMKAMGAGMKGAKGSSFMEDYTNHFGVGSDGAILQAHMLEVCPTIAAEKPRIVVSPLSMGEREDPARLVFTSKPGAGVACSLVDLGTRFRLIIAEVDCLAQERPMPNLPVASALWCPRPDFATGIEAWLIAGGAHHTAFSYDLTSEQMCDWAEAMGIEAVVIDSSTNIRSLKNELRWNAAAAD